MMLFSSCAYAALAGGKAGFYCAFLFLAAAFLSMIPLEYDHWQSTDIYVLGIDFLCFLCLTLLSMTYNRCWLIWCAGLQLSGLATHTATIFAPAYSPLVYQALSEFWSIPILLVMVFGIALDRKAEQKNSSQ